VEFSASVVNSQDDLAKAFAIRSAVFISEQKCPYDEEFDGNDFCATHILAFIDGEPAGTMRVRWFADFAKVERFSVLPHFRRRELTKAMIDLSVDLVTRKGYTTMYGHVQRRLVPFWEKYGFRRMERDLKLVFSDHEYVEMLGEMPRRSDAITLAGDPRVLLRPEGSWDLEGVLERSVARAATNPH
jgi:predicted GNAT family N-acyltransferase